MGAARRGRQRVARMKEPRRGWRAAAREREQEKGWPTRWQRRRRRVGREPAPRLRQARRTTTWRQPAPGSGSQSEVATGDDVLRFAHAEDVDELARVLEAAEVRAVVDDLLCECLGEAGDGQQLVDSCLVEC